jgi:hypothetical protein
MSNRKQPQRIPVVTPFDLEDAIALAVRERDTRRDVQRERETARQADEITHLLASFQRAVERHVPTALRDILHWRYGAISSKGRNVWWADIEAIALFNDPLAPSIELALECGANYTDWRVIRPDQANNHWLDYVLAETQQPEGIAFAVLIGLHDFRVRFAEEIEAAQLRKEAQQDASA